MTADWPGDTAPLPHQPVGDRLGARLAGMVAPRMRVFLGSRSGCWRWVCPACEPHNLGGYCMTWRSAISAARNHIEDHHAPTREDA